MLQQGKTKDAVEYLQDLMGTVENLSKKYVTGDALLDSIVGLKVQTMKQNGIHSKADAASHGIGTYNMKYTVESYGAMIKAECTEEIFRLEIMLDKSSPE